MPFEMNETQINELCSFALISDKEARSDLSRSFISSENDYTSNFTGALRRIINSNSSSGLTATSFLLPKSEEQKTGTDATIIVENGGQTKVILFEAKWPRLQSDSFRWDYRQTASNLSHFSDQLERQAQFTMFAIFEIFYLEFPFTEQPDHLPDYSSACVWHENAYSFMKGRDKPNSIWERGDLTKLLRKQNHDIEEVLRQACSCLKGNPISIPSALETAQEFSLTGEILAISTKRSDNYEQ